MQSNEPQCNHDLHFRGSTMVGYAFTSSRGFPFHFIADRSIDCSFNLRHHISTLLLPTISQKFSGPVLVSWFGWHFPKHEAKWNSTKVTGGLCYCGAKQRIIGELGGAVDDDENSAVMLPTGETQQTNKQTLEAQVLKFYCISI